MSDSIFSSLDVARRAQTIRNELYERLVEATGIGWHKGSNWAGFVLTPEHEGASWNARVEIKEQQVNMGFRHKGNGSIYVTIGTGSYSVTPLMRRDKIKGGVDYASIVNRAVQTISQSEEAQRKHASKSESRATSVEALGQFLEELEGFEEKDGGPALWYENSTEKWSLSPLAIDGDAKIRLTASVPIKRMHELLYLLVGEGFLTPS